MKHYINGLHKAWAEIGLSLVKQLVESMPKRIEAVINAKEGTTKY